MTRYPKSGRGRKWTVAELKAIPAEWRGDALRDGDGLVGVVRFNDGDNAPRVHFRYEFKRDGKKAWHYCGTWPTTSLDAIRHTRDEARETLRRRVDPNAKREAARVEEREHIKATLAAEKQRRAEDASVRELYDVWLRDGVLRKDGNAALKRSFEADVLPVLGAKPVRAVTEHDVRGVLRALVARGVNRTAVEVHRNIKQMFRWAEKRQPWRRLLLDGNPAELVEIVKVVDPDYDLSNIRSRVLNDDEIRELRDRLEAMARGYEASDDKRRAARPVELVKSKSKSKSSPTRRAAARSRGSAWPARACRPGSRSRPWRW